MADTTRSRFANEREYARRRPTRRADPDYEDQDQEQDGFDAFDEEEDELSDEETQLGLKVVELGPRAFYNVKRGSSGRIFQEFHPRHPDGEVLVVDGRRVKVYPTARVQAALGSGMLKETTKPPTPEPLQTADMLEQSRAEQSALKNALVADKAREAAAESAALAQRLAPVITDQQPSTEAQAPKAPARPSGKSN